MINIETMKYSLRSIAIMGMLFLLSCTLSVSYAGSPPVCDSSPKTELKSVCADAAIATAVVFAHVDAILVDNSFITSWHSSKVLTVQESNTGNTNKGYAGLPDKYGESLCNYALYRSNISTHRQNILKC